ncbi:MAG: Stk1 family PASTA domain-containing Ser/Thr kinase [Acetivibrionales bacterium]|jgi:serine/threonine protein kinase/beta-lactam-binding protein with PASTA domain
MEGKILGNRYQLIERIGSGGMAIVYKAKDLLLNRYVAVKILRSEFTDDEEFVKRFRVEAQAAASLNHPNIVSIYDVGKQEGIQYIVMEYIDGITLKEYIAGKGALPWREAVGIAIQICSAIEHAHRNHIVHRDIKPHNIMITSEGIAKVTDFGIARAVTSATITMVGSTIGSVHYFSPEQARGGFTDEKSDLYSLGITIYEMVTGRVPFDGESPVAVALKHIQERAERPSDVNSSIPRGINDIIVKAMKKDQNLRYQSASEMLNDLETVLYEPNAKIAGSNAVEDLPTKKMKAVGKEVKTLWDEEDNEIGNEEISKDSDDLMGSNKKRDRLSVWLGIAAGLVIAAVIFYIGFKIVIPAILPDNTDVYVVEDFKNRNFFDVREELKKYDIEAIDERIYHDTVGQDIIISQSVAAGNTLKPGSSIKFVVSDGIELVQVPDIAGEESRVGEQIIKDHGLKVNEVHEHSETVGTGLIIKTEPDAFEKVRPGETVTVYVSLGPKLEKVVVPNLIGLTRKEAEKLILESNLRIGNIIPEDIVSDVAKIIRQYPYAGEEVEEETAVEMEFEIESDPGPGQPEDSRDGDNGQVPGNGQEGREPSKKRTKRITVSLNPFVDYGDEVMVYVETTPSDTNVTKVEFNSLVAKKNFPFSIEITLAERGTTHLIVKLDGLLAQETDIE